MPAHEAALMIELEEGTKDVMDGFYHYSNTYSFHSEWTIAYIGKIFIDQSMFGPGVRVVSTPASSPEGQRFKS